MPDPATRHGPENRQGARNAKGLALPRRLIALAACVTQPWRLGVLAVRRLTRTRPACECAPLLEVARRLAEHPVAETLHLRQLRGLLRADDVVGLVDRQRDREGPREPPGQQVLDHERKARQ